jgi:hypothetical protein
VAVVWTGCHRSRDRLQDSRHVKRLSSASRVSQGFPFAPATSCSRLQERDNNPPSHAAVSPHSAAVVISLISPSCSAAPSASSPSPLHSRRAPSRVHPPSTKPPASSCPAHAFPPRLHEYRRRSSKAPSFVVSCPISSPISPSLTTRSLASSLLSQYSRRVADRV